MELMIGLVTVALLALVLYTVFTTPASTGCLSEDARRAKAAAAAAAQRKAEAAASKAAAVGTEGAERFLAPKPGTAAVKEVAKESKAAAPAKAPAAEAPAKAEAAPVTAAELAKAEEPAKAAAAPTATPAKAPAAAAPASADITLRDPATGDKAAVPANYRFAKKWIKEALVKEGLLDKVYKNNELDAEASKKVKAALEQFKTLAKYHA